MTRFEELKNMDIEALAEWLDEHGQFDNSPWMLWFDQKYCKNCEPIKAIVRNFGFDKECEFSYCECEGKCRFFPEREETLDNKENIKMWLESEVEV